MVDPMNFSKVLAELGGRLDAAGVRYALILLLVTAAARQGRAIDWALVEDYLRLLKLEDKLPELKSAYGPPE